jgi:hypothetical protein
MQELGELVFRVLAEGRLPTVPNAKPAVDLLAERLRELNRSRVLAVNKALLVYAERAWRKLVKITGELAGYRMTYKSAYVAKRGDELAFRATYTYTGAKPELITMELRAGESRKSRADLFTPMERRTEEVRVPVSEPGNLSCRARSFPRIRGPIRYALARRRIYNELSQVYPVGLLDDRYKPVSEYPVSGADNAVLDVPYSWRVENTVYPSPPAEVVFDNLAVSFQSGFVSHEGKYYKDPSVNNTVRVTARVMNRSSYTLTARHYGLAVLVLYEDNRHVSQVNVSVSFPDTTLSPGASRSYYFDVNLPTWAYGKVAVAHALRFYRGDTLFWTGGPLYCFEVFRLRLP